MEIQEFWKRMRFLDCFSGIGGFRFGMEQAGHKCIGYIEVDKFARKSYESYFDVRGEWTRHDIREVTDSEWAELKGEVEILCGGFPCQAFSIAGNRRGFQDARGTLFFEIARATQQIKPRFLFLENVRGLLFHNKGQTFATILSTLDELGYDAEWQMFNSSDYVPQNRERIFIIGHLRGSGTREIFPIRKGCTENNGIKIAGNLEKGGTYTSDMNRRLYDTSGIAPALNTMQGGGQEPKILIPQIDRTNRKLKCMISSTAPTIRATQYKAGDSQPKVILPVLTPDRPEKRQNGRRFKEDGEEMFTLTGQDRHGVAIEDNGFRIRKLTPRECWRLQGFPDWAFDKASKVNSDCQLYKQAGNAVTVNVVYEIGRRLK